MKEKVKEDFRNSFLYEEALGLHRAGIAASVSLRKLREVNQTMCDPPLGEQVVKGIIANIFSRRENG